ncbi:MAG TPA: DUF222 domain-containing protein [Microbacterium sp.]|nr:DUF222 domain-containing protein [Microbacterium sp.]
MKPLAETLEALERALGETVASAFDADDVRGLPDDQLLGVMAVAARIARRAEAILVEVTGQIQDRSDSGIRDSRLTTRMGCRSVSELVQRATLASRQTVSGYERAARGIREDVAIASGEKLPAQYPSVRAAMIDGAMGVDGLVAVIGPLSRLAGDAGRAAHLAADEELSACARGEGVDSSPPACADDLRALAHVWAVYFDQDGAEPRGSNAMRKRGLTLGVVRDGVVPVRGQLLPEIAAQLQRIFDALLNPKLDGPRFTDTERLTRIRGRAPYGDGVSEPGGGDDGSQGTPLDQADTRTTAQKQHDALATALSVAARSGELPTVGGAAPTLVVAVRAEDLASGRGYAHAEGADEPIAIGLARHSACDGVVQRVVSDQSGRIIGIHTRDRVFNHHQRKAVALRDGGCIIPGCRIPAGWCEIHHVTEHARGGPTHTDNGVLLCWHHHRTLDTSGWAIRMNLGTPEVRGPAWWDPVQRWRPATTSRIRMLDRVIRRR